MTKKYERLVAVIKEEREEWSKEANDAYAEGDMGGHVWSKTIVETLDSILEKASGDA